jgi:hypothetical protein
VAIRVISQIDLAVFKAVGPVKPVLNLQSQDILDLRLIRVEGHQLYASGGEGVAMSVGIHNRHGAV